MDEGFEGKTWRRVINRRISREIGFENGRWYVNEVSRCSVRCRLINAPFDFGENYTDERRRTFFV